jgi:formamidopyrimidine-DNA glycosylase
VPELPETETIARDLDRELTGVGIVGARIYKSDVLRGVSPRALERRLSGARIERGWRRAKLIVLDLSSGDRLVVQPRFTGALLLDDGSLDERERAYSTLELRLSDGRALHYRDIRRLGTVTLFAPREFERYAAALGEEPLAPGFTIARFSALVRESRVAIKRLLMDQRRVAGVGNIYAKEALWRAGIDPSREGRALRASEIEALHSAIVAVLAEAVDARGTSFRDYRDASGSRGGFAARLQAYGRAGQPCHRCGTRLSGTHALDGRLTVFCHRCQR